MDDRRSLHVRLSDEAHEGLAEVCASAGVTITAWLECAGLYFFEGGKPTPEFIERAKVIDSERRRRRG